MSRLFEQYNSGMKKSLARKNPIRQRYGNP